MVLLHFWLAVMGRRRRSWYALGGAAALILLTADAALILLGALAVFTAVTKRGRTALEATEPWIVAVALVVFLFLHLIWLQGAGDSLTTTLEHLRTAQEYDAARLHVFEVGHNEGLSFE